MQDADRPSRDELITAARNVAGDARIKHLLLELQLCAELYPDELRKALATAFNVEAVLARLDQIVVLSNRAAHDAEEARVLADEVTRDIDARLSKVSDWAEWLDKRYRAGYERMKNYIARFNEWQQSHKTPAPRATTNGVKPK